MLAEKLGDALGCLSLRMADEIGNDERTGRSAGATISQARVPVPPKNLRRRTASDPEKKTSRKKEKESRVRTLPGHSETQRL
jgi:hypothetical protein